MADLPNRLQHESEVAREIAAILARYRSEWESGQAAPQTERSLKEKLLALLALLFGLGASTAAGELGIAIVTTGAAKAWSETYSTFLSRRIVDGISKRIQRARTKDLTNQTTLLADTVDAIASPQNWANLAATEVTRANTAGGEFSAAVFNIGKLNDVQKSAGTSGNAAGPVVPGEPAITPPGTGGITPEPPTVPEVAQAYWYTAKDDRVCPICKPLDGVPRDVWQSQFPMGPPAHAVCRCWIDYQVGAREQVESTDGG